MHESPEDIKNREAAHERLSQVGKKYFKLVEFDANEELYGEIRKHPFGLFVLILIAAFIVLSIMGATIAISLIDLNEIFGAGNLNSFRAIFALLGFLLVIGAIIGAAIAVFLYVSNVIFVTSEKIAQVLYISLFNRKISQLSIGDVQDVTVTQKGIFAHIFNYGTLVIETAGEQQNYTFTYVPDPYNQSKMIVNAHEKNLAKFGN